MSIPPTKYQSLADLKKLQTNQNTYQQSARPLYQERKWLSQYQYQIYRTALYGLNAFSKKELYKMSIVAKNRIAKFYRRAQEILNRWKQQLVNELFEELCSIKYSKFAFNPFKKVFDDTTIGVEKFGRTTDDSFECTLTFVQLKISREQIIYKLINEQVLPTNFYQLNQ